MGLGTGKTREKSEIDVVVVCVMNVVVVCVMDVVVARLRGAFLAVYCGKLFT